MHDDAWEEDDDRVADDENDDEDDDETIPCPYCGRRIYEESERCPYCENYILDEDRENAVSPRKPWWILVGTLLVFYIVYRWIIGG